MTPRGWDEDGRDDAEPQPTDSASEPSTDPPPRSEPEPEPEPVPDTVPDRDAEFARCLAEVTADPDDPAWTYYTELGLDPHGVCTVLMAS